MENPSQDRRNMLDWGNAPTWRQRTIMKGHWPALPAETQLRHELVHQTAQQPPAKNHPSPVSCKAKPETPELFKVRVTDAESEAPFGQRSQVL